jgi:hypothetical protein
MRHDTIRMLKKTLLEDAPLWRDRMEPKRPDPARLEALRNLPKDVMQSLSKEEVNAFLFEDEWPNSLKEKLKNYMIDDA